MVKNINRLLENSVRSDVIGYNIFTAGRKTEGHRIPQEREYGFLPASHWDKPTFGLTGLSAIGHHLDTDGLITFTVAEGDKPLTFDTARNYWTPAYMKTHYRSAADKEEYPYAGCLCVYEEKCILPDDTFIAHVTFYNDKREDCTFTVKLELPFERQAEGKYRVEAKTVPRSLGRVYPVIGFAAACNEQGKDHFTVTVPAGGEASFSYGFAFDPDSFIAAKERLTAALAMEDPAAIKEQHFNGWMAHHVPRLSTDHTDMLKVYYYRNFVIYRAIHSPDRVIKDHAFQGECVYESPFGGWFGAPVGLPIPMQIEEMKWMKTSDTVRSHIHNWSKGAGATAGYIQYTPWAIWRLYQHHPDKEFLRLYYDACKAFTLRGYDTENPQQLPIQVGSWGTGAEYQPAFYQYTDPPWDWRCDTEGKRDYGFAIASLYRVEVCVMLAANLKACGKMAEVLENSEEATRFDRLFRQVREQIIRRFWNEKEQFFFDCETKEYKQCDLAPVYDGFTPMMFDLVGEGFDAAFYRLLDEKQFKANFPAPTAGKSCPMYWFDNCIVGPCASSVKEPKTYGCSWNGPTWPYANTQILEALGAAAKRNQELKGLFLDFFTRYTDLHFLYGDRSCPNIVEHYRSTDGAAFSPFNEYFHSEWISLFMEYYAGITVKNGEVSFTPMTADEFVLEDVHIGGKRYTFRQYTENGVLKQKIIDL